LLGEGSYASVWECDVLSGDILGKRVALKELKARDVNGANMEQMMLEVKALKSLQGDGVPPYIAHDVNGPVVRLLMGVVDGQPLDQWMTTSGVDGLQHPLDLLAQVGSTLSLSHYLHRDINVRNILVSGAATDPTAWHCIGGPPSPRGHVFTLIDFGTAVDLRAWRGASGPGSWAVLPAAGDNRYWPPSAWMRFFQAPRPPRLAPPWHMQYCEHLDRYALALVVLEVFFAQSGKEARFERLEATWTAYRSFAQQTWQNLTTWSFKQVGGPRAAGDPRVTADQAWQELLRADIPRLATARLQELLAALKAAEAASTSAGQLLGLCRRMMTPEDAITVADVARAARQAADRDDVND
jgi:serine/threonine protein kinase